MKLIVSSFAALTTCGTAFADDIPYPYPHTPNTAIYTFTAATTGAVTAYFAGSTANYDEKVGMLVNGVSTGVIGLDDHSSALGRKIDFGAVNAGDTLTFVLYVSTTGAVWYSNSSRNVDRANHVYSANATAGQVYKNSPAGTYVAFEDLPAKSSDFNYHDDTFIFENVAIAVTYPPNNVRGWR